MDISDAGGDEAETLEGWEVEEGPDQVPTRLTTKWNCFGAWDGPQTPVGRNRLISLMLQDRSVLRLVCAPHGFGKTRLVREYADRLFSGRKIIWIEASEPSFLSQLDSGRLDGVPTDEESAPDLLIIDDLPWLHERRAEALSRCIDSLLLVDCEVVVTTLPSCNSLRSLQADCILVTARDLLVGHAEFMGARQSATKEERSLLSEIWDAKARQFCGRAPAVIWSDKREIHRETVAALFSEHLEIGVLRAMLSIVVLGEGTSDDFESVGIVLRREELSLLAEDYALMESRSTGFTFDFEPFDLAALAQDLARQGLFGSLIAEAPRFVESLVGLLLSRDNAKRAEEALEAFFTERQCLSWVREHGWTLLDRGEVTFVDSLLERCQDTANRSDRIIWALRSWTSGLLGDERFAVHFAQKTLRTLPVDETDSDDDHMAVAAAYLALVAFGRGGTALYGKRRLSSNQEPVAAGEFLESLVDICTEVELARALSCDDPERLDELEIQRSVPERSRSRAFERLCMLASDRLFPPCLYRFMLHVGFSIDDPKTREFLQDAGCDVVVEVKRHGITSYTEALVIRDLWQSGYFGLGGSARDAVLFEQTGDFLRMMSELRGGEPPLLPWGQERASGIRVTSDEVAVSTEEIEPMRVRLFGSFDVMIGDAYLSESAWRKKSRLLFILLVLHQGRDISRDFLFDEMWQGMSRVRALDNFYTLWSSTCSTLGNKPYIERNGEFCRVNSRFVISDVFEFEQLTRRLLTEHPDVGTLLDIYARLESLYRGGLVPSETDSSFINARRVRYRSMFVDAMVAGTNCALEVRDVRVALWFARKAYEAREKREDVYCALIRAQIAAGQRCSAIKTFIECREYLRSELGLDPSCETQELYDQLIKTDPSLLKLDASTFRR